MNFTAAFIFADFTPDPVAFTVFGLEIRWYALLICTGMIIASFIACKRAPKRGLSSDDFLDMLLFCIPAGIIGARAWYVIFNWENYHSLFDIINTRAGGLAIQGGLLFGIITAWLVSRHKKISLLNVLDTALPCVALAQSIGRWGNFFNQEAYGSPTSLPWAITIDGVSVHPTFLYESLWCLFLFFLLSWKDKRKSFNGQTMCLYAILYSVERFFVEQLRTDSLFAGSRELVSALREAAFDPAAVDGVVHIGKFLIYPFKTAQFISLASIIAGLILYRILNKNQKRKVSQ